MFTLIVDWRSPNDCRATHAAQDGADIADVLSGLAKTLRSHAVESGKATVVLTLKDKSSAGAAARKLKKKR